MPRNRRLKPSERLQILRAVKNRVPLRDISHNLHIPYNTVKTIKQKANTRGELQHNLPRSERSRQSTPTADQRLLRHTKIRNNIPWKEVVQLSSIKQTQIRQRFKEIDKNWGRFQRKRKPKITRMTAKKRLEWAQEYQSWKPEDWAEIWFTDECSIEAGSDEYRQWI